MVSMAVMAAMAVDAPRGDEMLDSDPICDIMILTHAASPRQHPEAPRPPSDGHAQFAARPGDRRVIRRQRLLRSARPPAGEVRNAAPRPPRRRRHSESGGTALRILASVLLSRSRSVHARR